MQLPACLCFVSDICLPAMLPVTGEEEKDNPRQERMNGSGQMVSDSLPDRLCDRLSAVTVSRQQTVCMTMDCQL